MDGTVVKPPPGPPPLSPRIAESRGAAIVGDRRVDMERPEEPAKYINELPKLGAAEISTSAVLCGNWLAQLRQILIGLSPTAVNWWTNVERVANSQYQRWLVADPLDRLLLDPATVAASFDPVRYQLVESRAVSLILAAIPGPVKDEAVSNRWLTSASLLFRIQCIYQPGGSSERAMLLSQLVSPEIVKSFSQGVTVLRKWQQYFGRVRELRASLPDSSLLLKGVDLSTSSILSQNPLLGFRVNAFRNRVSLDYNPTLGGVLQLVKLLQAEFESAALSADSGNVPKGRIAQMQTGQVSPSPAPPRPPVPKGPVLPNEGQLKAFGASEEAKGKGKGKGKAKSEGEVNLCYSFMEGKGCRYGDACKFRHDRASARKQKRCLACGQEGHYRPECPLVPPENRVVQEPPSLVAGSAAVPRPPVPKRPPTPKAKSTPQAKVVIEDFSGGSEATLGGGGPSQNGTEAREVLLAEAAKLLKGVSLKPLRVADEGPKEPSLGSFGVDWGWLVSAVTNASDPRYALIDSGATNALRPAEAEELLSSKVIKVDLASGATELHVTRHGTLLSRNPCQVIIPAGYLVQMGYAISWRKGSCVVKKKGRQPLEVKLVKGCPLVSRSVGLRLLKEYEEGLDRNDFQALKPLSLRNCGEEMRVAAPIVSSAEEGRKFLARCVMSGSLTRGEQLCWLESVFPEAPRTYLERAAGQDADLVGISLEGVPWNRRRRRSVLRSRRGEVLLHVFSGSRSGGAREPWWR